MDTNSGLWTMHWLYRDVLIKTLLINQIKQPIKNLIRILKTRETRHLNGWQRIWCPLWQYWHILAKFMSVFANSYFEWLKYLQRNCDTIDRQTGPGTVFSSNAITRWNKMRERRGEMIKTARSYYKKVRYIEKWTRKGKEGRNDHFQVCAVIITCQKIGNHGKSFIWNGINLMPSPEIVMRSRNIK